jgi:multicomponent Na+:H+ antiporter subunit A
MLVLLAVFLVASIALPALTRVLGVRAFPVAALVPAAAFAFTLLQGPAVLPDGEVVERFEWIPSLGVTLDMRMDALSWLLSLVVTGVGALVLLYCARYFRSSEEGLGRFAGLLLAFAGVMYGLVLADDVFVLFTFWEATSVLSYLLIGHYTGKKASRGAALQALLVTTAGGLAMLVGLVILSVAGGTTSLQALVEDPPAGSLIPVAVVLVLLGALSKSALVPFHFWLPAAMAAPTPVSAYLHAAAMVKAGIYLIARLAPGYADVPGWRVLLVSLGVATMLVGGWRALKQMDLKLVLAYGTVSQLGFLTVVVGYGTRDAALAGVALLLAHALFKATLFLVVGVVDHRTGTRDLRKISGLGRKAPVLAVITAAALASMAGLPPFLGFVAKEAVLSALLLDAELGGGLGWLALVGVSVGSCLTVAYSARFMWGAFARKRGVDEVQPVHEHLDFLVPPAVLAATGLVLGLLASSVDGWIAGYADTLPAVSAGASGEPDHTYHLALWHGIEPALLISAGTLVVGLAMFRLRDGVFALQSRVPAWVDAARIYWASMRLIDRVAARTTATTQRGSLPFYLGVILLVLIGSVGSALALNRSWPTTAVPFDHPAQPVIGVVMIVAAVAAARAGKRFQAVVLVGVTGYGMAALFALHGAPDLALTQVLIETITLVAFVLVLRRLPVRLGERNRSVHPVWRASIGIAVAVLMSTVAVVALGARVADPISLEFPQLAYEQGHGSNVVNVTLVDLRGWDTMGEISVLIVAATGVASLIFLNRRTDSLPRLTAPSRRRTPRPSRSSTASTARGWTPGTPSRTRGAWSAAPGSSRAGRSRRRTARSCSRSSSGSCSTASSSCPSTSCSPATTCRAAGSRAASSPAWRSSRGTSPEAATSSAPPPRSTRVACSAPASSSRSAPRSCRSCSASTPSPPPGSTPRCRSSGTSSSSPARSSTSASTSSSSASRSTCSAASARRSTARRRATGRSSRERTAWRPTRG